jgi:ATP/maltotriose-dependent transcriptional regulator MalT
MFLALAWCMVGQQDRALASLRAALKAADGSQPFLQSRLLGGLTFAHLLGGELLAARLQAQRLAHLATKQDMRLNKAWSQYFLGCTYLHAAELANAADRFEHAAAMRHLLEPLAAVDAMAGLALTKALMGRQDQAATVCDQLARFAQELDEGDCLAVAHSIRARVALLRGETAAADQWVLATDTDTEPAPHNLAIPHNANVSDGWMFSPNKFLGGPMDARYAERQNANEPLMEIIQTKGQSDAHPLMSPNDEFAEFEMFPNMINVGMPSQIKYG